MRDVPAHDLLTRLAGLRSRLIDPELPGRLKKARKRRSEAADELAIAQGRLPPGSTLLVEFEQAARSARSAAIRLENEAFSRADGALPEIRAASVELGDAVADLASLLKDAAEFAAQCGKAHPGIRAAWPAVDASARGLRAVAQQLGPQPKKRAATLRW